MAETNRNAIIMAAGTSSRFVPLSYERPKGLLEVNGEVLIERQIRQLHEAGVNDVTVVVGYKNEMFEYLKEKLGVVVIMNEDYERFNNTSSLFRVLDKLGNTFICSSDNYFPHNVFRDEATHSYYSAQYAEGETGEYCITSNQDGVIEDVSIGGANSWFMIGHVYFSSEFSNAFVPVFREEYEKEETKEQYWEDVYIKHLKSLPGMKIRKYEAGEIMEFDSLDELRDFDASYIKDSRSCLIKELARRLNCQESDLSAFKKEGADMEIPKFSFLKNNVRYMYDGIVDTVMTL